MAAERAGVDTGELEEEPLPAGCELLLELYWQLRRAAGSGGFGHAAIAFSEIAAWQSLTGVELTSAELDLLTDMDAAALAAFAESVE